mgnify:CR=1 FL=1
MSLIQLENVSKSYGKQQVLADVSLKINDGDRLGLVGRNGSGKRHLLMLLPVTFLTLKESCIKLSMRKLLTFGKMRN